MRAGRRHAPSRLIAAGLLVGAVLAIAGCGAPAEPERSGVEAAAEQGPVVLRVEAAPSVVRPGDPIELRVSARWPADWRVGLEPLPEDLGPFHVRESRTPPDVPGESPGTRRIAHVHEIDTFKEGAVEIPAVQAQVVGPDGRTTRLEAGPLTVEVEQVVEAEAAPETMRDVAGLVETSAERETPAWWWWTGGGAIVLAAIAALLLRRRSARPGPPPDPPWLVAHRALAALEVEDVFHVQGPEPFFDELTRIVRRYVEDRFGLHAPERTTDEFLREARRAAAIPDAWRDRLGDFLRAADLVKFAKARPAAGEAADALASARRFVEATTPSEAREGGP